jgi:hypothetical protein
VSRAGRHQHRPSVIGFVLWHHGHLGLFLLFCSKDLRGGLKHPERQFPKNPGPRRRSVTPVGPDPEHPAIFPEHPYHPSVLDA